MIAAVLPAKKAGPLFAEKLYLMPCVYILQSISLKRTYVGSSREDSPLERLSMHNAGRVRSTKAYKPWIILYQEYFSGYTEARKRELFLKTGIGRNWIKENILKGN